MNVIKATSRLHKVYSSQIVRRASHWYNDYKPGPYPKTEEERIKAAKKYNLLPEEYEPYPEDEGLGDYPKLPMISGMSKDPYYNWDHPNLRKDHGETMHLMANCIGLDRWDCNSNEKQQMPYTKQIVWFLTAFFGMMIPHILLEDYKFCLPHMKKHLPTDGKHYKYPTSSH